MYGFVCGTLRCRRCGGRAESWCQTKEVFAPGWDLYGERRAGDRVEFDDLGLAEFHRLRAWVPPGPVRAVLGDATCPLCRMPEQWLAARFDPVEWVPGEGYYRAVLGEVATFDAADPGAYAHVEYLCGDLCQYANYPAGGPYSYPPPAFSVPPDRVPAEIAAGYARWLDDHSQDRFGRPG